METEDGPKNPAGNAQRRKRFRAAMGAGLAGIKEKQRAEVEASIEPGGDVPHTPTAVSSAARGEAFTRMSDTLAPTDPTDTSVKN